MIDNHTLLWALIFGFLLSSLPRGGGSLIRGLGYQTINSEVSSKWVVPKIMGQFLYPAYSVLIYNQKGPVISRTARILSIFGTLNSNIALVPPYEIKIYRTYPRTGKESGTCHGYWFIEGWCWIYTGVQRDR